MITGKKPILCLDFDGVCHMYTSGWKGAAVIPDPPVPGLFRFLWRAQIDFDVAIFSSRSNQAGGIEAMKAWFIKHATEYNEQNPVPDVPVADARVNAEYMVNTMLTFPTEKPPAFLGLDDRVLTFNGTWPNVEEMKAFKTWTNRGVS